MADKRSHSEAFPDEDDQWIFDPQLDAAILASRQEEQRGRALLEFGLYPIGPRRRWQNVLNKQRYQARLQQTREATPQDDLNHEVTQALLRQIDEDPTLTPNSTLHFTMEFGTFDHAFQSATLRVREVQEDSQRLSTYLQTLDSETQLEPGRHPRPHVQSGNDLHSHPGSRPWPWETLPSRPVCRPRHRQTFHHPHQEPRPVVLCQGHRHHAGLGRRTGG